MELSRTVLALPSALVEGAAISLLPGHVDLYGRTLFDRSPGAEDFAALFTRTYIRKELSFFAGFASSDLATPGVEEGTEEIDEHRFNEYQVKILVDSVKKAYRERFGLPSMDLDAVIATFSTGDWLEAIVLPTAVSAYAVRFGVDRKWQLWEDVRISLHLERGTRLYRTLAEDSRHSIGSLGLNLFRLPVSIFLVVDADAGRLETSFLGIGTDLSTVHMVVSRAESDPRQD